MTSFLYQPADNPAPAVSSSLHRLTGRISMAWRLHRIERELESLPFDLRKDIGFPAAGMLSRGRKNP